MCSRFVGQQEYKTYRNGALANPENQRMSVVFTQKCIGRGGWAKYEGLEIQLIDPAINYEQINNIFNGYLHIEILKKKTRTKTKS